jgi:hypothetical protein
VEAKSIFGQKKVFVRLRHILARVDNSKLTQTSNWSIVPRDPTKPITENNFEVLHYTQKPLLFRIWTETENKEKYVSVLHLCLNEGSLV